ncbi:MAG: hypothetical protein WBP94_01140 [Rhodomicrobiaceae bacterium]
MRFSARMIVVLALAGVAMTEPAFAAASICKGLDKSGCDGQTRCSWVKSHKTAKGKDVAAFCRKKPERKKANEAAVAAPKG